MNLEEFITETMKQIIKGVNSAQEFAKENGAAINPYPIRKAKPVYYDDRKENRDIEVIDFDVAVSTTEGTGKQGGAGLFVGPVAFGAKGRSEATNSAESRIKFSVPVALPVQE